MEKKNLPGPSSKDTPLENQNRSLSKLKKDSGSNSVVLARETTFGRHSYALGECQVILKLVNSILGEKVQEAN
jgi:hypothetical protein